MEEGRSARVFLAVGVSADVAAAVGRLQKALGRDAPDGLLRFAPPDQTHVTLRFLGQRSSDEQERIERAARAAAEGWGPFHLVFGGLGVFPDERRPHTLWMGLLEGSCQLVALAARLETRLAGEGFAAEERPFVPHLTVARVKGRTLPSVIKGLLGLGSEATGAQRVESFALMESRPTGAGVRYVPLRIFRLETACTPSK